MTTKNEVENNQPKTPKHHKHHKLYVETKIWKSVLIMVLPSLLLMFVNGAYFFTDSVFSINFAADSYKPMPLMSSEDQVRVFMNGYSPINSLMIAITMFFAMGIATRVAINLGQKNPERAINSIKVGTMFGMAISIIMVPILMFTAKPWISSQYDPSIASKVADESFKFAWIIIMSLPLMMFNQIIPSLFRVEARNKEMLIATLSPLIVNLLLDWVFMGPLGMGVEGGAWATFVSTCLTTILLIIFIAMRKESFTRFKNLFGFKFQVIGLVGILLVGIAPFLRNMAQSITSTVQMSIIKDVSEHVYSSKGTYAGNYMTLIITGAMPIFGLFFPLMFAFAQASRPIASYNYGAKNYRRVVETYIWTIFYASIIGIIVYFLVAWAIGNPLMTLLHVTGEEKKKAAMVLKIMLITLPLFALSIGSMVIFGSTDRLLQSILASSMQGLIMFWPVIFTFKAIAINNPSYEYLFWWMWPTSALITSLITTFMAIFTLRNMYKNKPQKTLDDRINAIYDWQKRRKQNKLEIKK